LAYPLEISAKRVSKLLFSARLEKFRLPLVSPSLVRKLSFSGAKKRNQKMKINETEQNFRQSWPLKGFPALASEQFQSFSHLPAKNTEN
jgi:hypothetical protein